MTQIFRTVLCVALCLFMSAPSAEAQVNLAIGGTATQSSTDFGGLPARGIDGNISGRWGDRSVTHTARRFQPWWQVDLGAVESISTISLYNRTDCCAARGSNFHVFVSDVPFTGSTVADSQAQAGVLDIFVSGQMGRPTSVDVNRSGRYVRVQLSGTNYLQIAEVQVFQGLGEIEVVSSETGPITDGGTDNQGTIPAGTPKTDRYTVTNSGPVNLTLSGTPSVSSLSNVQDVTVSAPTRLVIPAGETASFDVTFTPVVAGAFSLDVAVESDDADEATFDIAITGMASDVTPPDAPVISSFETERDGSVVVEGTAEPGSEVTVTFPDGSTVVVMADGATGAFSATSAPGQPSGAISATARDGAGNVSGAASVAYFGAEETSREIAELQYERTNLLIANQPDLIGFLSGSRRTTGGATVSQLGGSLSFSLSQDDSPVWVDLSANWATGETSETSYAFAAAGRHWSVNDRLLVGGMVQADYISRDDGAADASGSGWMVGPYFVARAPEAPLFFEGRLLYGQSDNSVSPMGTFEDDFQSERVLARLKIAGQVDMKGLVIEPNVLATYASDRQEAFVDSNAVAIAGQKVEVSQIEAGIDVSMPWETGVGTIEVFGGLSGIYSEASGTGTAASVVPEYDGARGRIEVGSTLVTGLNGILSATASYDGIGSDYESLGVNLRYELNF